MNRKIVFLLLAACLILGGCGSTDTVITEQSNEETDVNMPSYIVEKAFEDYIYTNPYEADFQMTDALENIHSEYGKSPLCWESAEEGISVQIYVLDNKTVFVIRKDDGEYVFDEVSCNNGLDINDTHIRMDCYDLTGEGKKELVITYPRYIGGSGFWCYTLFVMDLENNEKIPVFYDGEERTEFTSQQSAEVNSIVEKWCMENTDDFTWWEPLTGDGNSKYAEVDVFQPVPCHYNDGDAILVELLRDPTHRDPVCMNVKLKYNNGIFEVSDMAITSWRKYTG